ncbi:DotA/TraY family protein [Vibrio alginolyticus]|uniref:DotA/TraY family protein n=1 Tax=Vibrio alginolyticus TaxID=663 RepID=UPI00301E2DFB
MTNMKRAFAKLIPFLALILASFQVIADDSDNGSAPTPILEHEQITNGTSAQKSIEAFQAGAVKDNLNRKINRETEALKQSGVDLQTLAEGTEEVYDYKVSPWWLPDGFFDGPSQLDMGYIALRYVFGEPVMKAFESVTGTTLDDRTPVTDPNYRNTLGLSYAQMMNTLGMILIGGVLIAYVIGFFIKRSLEIGYLKGDEKEETVFGLVRGSGAMIGSIPIQAFYGLSTFQMTTICAVVIGLGMSASIIKFSVGNLLTPSIVATQYPAVNEYIDSMLYAKVCVTALEEELDSKTDESEPNSRGIDGTYLYLEYQDRLSQGVFFETSTWGGRQNLKAIEKQNRIHKYYFGPDAECGSGVLGEIHDKDNIGRRFDNAHEAITSYTESEMGRLAMSYIRELWQELEPFATNINKENYASLTTISDGKELPLSISDSKAYAALKFKYSRKIVTAIDRMLKDFYDSPLIIPTRGRTPEATTTINAMRDDIASVGMFGLGSSYTSLAQMQDSFSDPVENSFRPVDSVTFKSNRISWYSFYFTTYLSLLDFFDNDDEKLVKIQEQYKAFISSPYASGSQDILTASVNQITETSRFGIVEAIVRKAAVSAFAYLATGELDGSNLNYAATDPILQLRNIGRTVQNSALAFWLMPSLYDMISGNSTDDSQNDSEVGADSFKSGVPGIIVLLVLSLFTWGFFMTNIIPYIPYIMWTIACFSYLSFAVMAILGTGWWGGGMTLKGQQAESYMGRSQEGINILISLIIRPPLMTIGFFMALVLNKVLGFIVNSTIQPAMISANAGITNPMMLIGLFIVSSIVLTIGIYKNMTLIWELTDLFMRWIGLDRDHLQEDGAKNAQTQFVSSGQSSSSQMNQIMSKATTKQGQIPFA